MKELKIFTLVCLASLGAAIWFWLATEVSFLFFFTLFPFAALIGIAVEKIDWVDKDNKEQS